MKQGPYLDIDLRAPIIEVPDFKNPDSLFVLDLGQVKVKSTI